MKPTADRLAAAALLLLIGSLAVEAQPAVRVHRVGFISPLPGSPEPPTLRPFRQGLRELGCVEGKNVIVETRFAECHQERLSELVAELLRLKVDVLAVGSEPRFQRRRIEHDSPKDRDATWQDSGDMA